MKGDVTMRKKIYIKPMSDVIRNDFVFGWMKEYMSEPLGDNDNKVPGSIIDTPSDSEEWGEQGSNSSSLWLD
mgnify:CR=1 FL=1